MQISKANPYNKTANTIIFVILTVLVSGCMSADQDQAGHMLEELRVNQALWEMRKTEDYSYFVRQDCETCVTNNRFRVFVDDSGTKYVNRSENSHENVIPSYPTTVDELFEFIEVHANDDIKVTYSQEWGFPSKIELHSNQAYEQTLSLGPYISYTEELRRLQEAQELWNKTQPDNLEIWLIDFTPPLSQHSNLTTSEDLFKLAKRTIENRDLDDFSITYHHKYSFPSSIWILPHLPQGQFVDGYTDYSTQIRTLDD